MPFSIMTVSARGFRHFHRWISMITRSAYKWNAKLWIFLSVHGLFAVENALFWRNSEGPQFSRWFFFLYGTYKLLELVFFFFFFTNHPFYWCVYFVQNQCKFFGINLNVLTNWWKLNLFSLEIHAIVLFVHGLIHIDKSYKCNKNGSHLYDTWSMVK